MTIAEIEELERLEKEAEKGPWNEDWCRGAVRHIDRNVDYDSFYFTPEGKEGEEVISWGRYDGTFIAKLRNSAPEIIALAKWAIRAKPFVRDALCLYEKGDHNKSLAAGLLADFPGGANE